MKLIIVVTLAFAGLISADVKPQLSYHEEVGIPLVSQIKLEEDTMFYGRSGTTNRIVGGATTPISAHPYLAGLLINFVNIAGTSGCGSSLLSSNRLVTAAHCWFDGTHQANLFTVVFGSDFLFYGGTRIPTNTVVMHPQYDSSRLLNDIAMIYLPTPVTFSAVIQPVALPSTTQINEAFTGWWSLAAGYGKTSDAQTGISLSSVVSYVNLQVISVAQCFASFGSWVTNNNICTNGAGGVGICGGDSGGPLVVFQNGQPVLVGISSFVAKDACQQGHPSAFTRVTSFYSFILQHLW